MVVHEINVQSQRTVSLSKHTYSSRMFLRLLTYLIIKTLAVGWAKVLRNLQCWGVLLAWAIVWTRACCACSRSGGNGHIFYSSVSPHLLAFSLFFLNFCFSPLSLLFFLPFFAASYTSRLFTCSRDTVSDVCWHSIMLTNLIKINTWKMTVLEPKKLAWNCIGMLSWCLVLSFLSAALDVEQSHDPSWFCFCWPKYFILQSPDLRTFQSALLI